MNFCETHGVMDQCEYFVQNIPTRERIDAIFGECLNPEAFEPGYKFHCSTCGSEEHDTIVCLKR